VEEALEALEALDAVVGKDGRHPESRMAIAAEAELAAMAAVQERNLPRILFIDLALPPTVRPHRVFDQVRHPIIQR